MALILGRDEDDEDDDHHTHEIFCELEELRHAADDTELEWKETARYPRSLISLIRITIISHHC